MARGKFNKRGGGKRVDAQSAQEIEQRNQRLAEFEEQRAKRRADAEEEENAEDEGGDDAKEETPQSVAEKPKAPVQVTSAEDHKRNMKKLETVRRRRAVAEQKRKEAEAAETALEDEQKAQAAAFLEEHDSDNDGGGKTKKKKNKEPEIPKLTKIEIKKMKPAQMKDALKLRGLDIQGNAKALTKRLVDYEAAR